MPDQFGLAVGLRGVPLVPQFDAQCALGEVVDRGDERLQLRAGARVDHGEHDRVNGPGCAGLVDGGGATGNRQRLATQLMATAGVHGMDMGAS